MRRIVVGTLAAVLVLGACAGGGDVSSTAEERGDLDAPGVAPAVDGEAPAPDDQGGQGEPAGDRVGVTGGGEGAGDGAGLTGAGADISESSLRKRIRRAEIDLAVEDGPRAFAEIRALTERSGGFVDGADLTRPDDGEGFSGTIVIRVPADGLDDVVDAITALAVEEPNVQLSTEDVTEEFIDLEARLKNLRILEAELQELLAEVREADDPDPAQLFTVFERLRQVRDEIEQIEGRRRLLEEQVSLSTVTIHLRQQPDTAAVPSDPWRPGQVLAEATSVLLTTLRGIANVAIWIGVVAVPIALVVGMPVALAAWVRRRTRGTTPA